MLPIKLKLQEIGAVKIGGLGKKTTSKNGKEFRLPEKHDKFTVVRKVRGDDDNYVPDAEIMKELLNPREVPIVFISNRINDIWTSYRSFYHTSGKSICRSEDEEWASRATKVKVDGGGHTLNFNVRDRLQCPNRECEFAINKQCKPFGRLQFTIPYSQELGGVYTFRTTSIYSITNIQSQLAYFLQLTSGMIAGLPFFLRMSPKTVRYDNGTKKSTFFEVSLHYKGSMVELLKIAEIRTKEVLSGKQKIYTAIGMKDKVIDADFRMFADDVMEYAPESYQIDNPERLLSEASESSIVEDDESYSLGDGEGETIEQAEAKVEKQAAQVQGDANGLL